jgi:hypothetical protein
MRKHIVMLLTLCLTSSYSYCQAPTLQETIAFLDHISRPDGHRVIAGAETCAISISSDKPYTFAMPTGSKDIPDQEGQVHAEFLWTGYESPDSLITFHLDQIDPSSVASDLAASPEFILNHRPVQPADLKNPDLAVVRFATRNDISAISGVPFGPVDKNPSTATRSMDFLIFHDRDHAERFVTALIQAVHACGGIVSDFPPAASTKLSHD